MKKHPRPEILLTVEDGRRVLTFVWADEEFSFETRVDMFDDEALVMARTIHDVLEEPPDEPELPDWDDTEGELREFEVQFIDDEYRTATVEARSPAEAYEMVMDGNYDDSTWTGSDNRRVEDVIEQS